MFLDEISGYCKEKRLQTLGSRPFGVTENAKTQKKHRKATGFTGGLNDVARCQPSEFSHSGCFQAEKKGTFHLIFREEKSDSFFLFAVEHVPLDVQLFAFPDVPAGFGMDSVRAHSTLMPTKCSTVVVPAVYAKKETNL